MSHRKRPRQALAGGFRALSVIPWIGYPGRKISSAVVHKLPKFASYSIVHVGYLFAKSSREIATEWWKILDKSITLQGLVGRRGHRARKPATDICGDRVCVGR